MVVSRPGPVPPPGDGRRNRTGVLSFTPFVSSNTWILASLPAISMTSARSDSCQAYASDFSLPNGPIKTDVQKVSKGLYDRAGCVCFFIHIYSIVPFPFLCPVPNGFAQSSKGRVG